jgi:hypothetical protein
MTPQETGGAFCGAVKDLGWMAGDKRISQHLSGAKPFQRI